MPYTAVDEALYKLESRRKVAAALRTVMIFFALVCLVGASAMAVIQLRRIDDMNIQITTLGELSSVIYVYVLAIAWGVGGLVGFAFFGWFALAWNHEASTLRAVTELEQARRRENS
jgi:hypothetical protein